MYENWTDVSGFLIADPRIIKNPKQIDGCVNRHAVCRAVDLDCVQVFCRVTLIAFKLVKICRYTG